MGGLETIILEELRAGILASAELSEEILLCSKFNAEYCTCQRKLEKTFAQLFSSQRVA